MVSTYVRSREIFGGRTRHSDEQLRHWADFGHQGISARVAPRSEIVVEVKPASKVPDYTEVFASATDKLRAIGIGFLVAQDVDILANKLHLRALRIRRYSKSGFDPVASDRLLSLLSEKPDGMTLAEAVNAAGVLPEQILYLIAHKQVCPLRTLDISPLAVILTRENYCREVKRLNYGNHANHFEVWFGVESWDSITHSDDDTW